MSLNYNDRKTALNKDYKSSNSIDHFFENTIDCVIFKKHSLEELGQLSLDFYRGLAFGVAWVVWGMELGGCPGVTLG